MKRIGAAICVLAASMMVSCFWIKPKDTDPPAWAQGYPTLGTAQATSLSVLVKTDEACTVWTLALASGAVQPSVDQIISEGTELSEIPADTERSVALTGLSASTAYDIYLAAEDEGGNRQEEGTLLSAMTTEAAPPAWAEGYPRLDEVLAESASVLVMTDESSTVWALALADGSPEPSAADLLNLGESTAGLPADTESTVTVDGLSGFTEYDLYLLAEDAHGNLQAAPFKLDFLTANPLAPSWESGGQPIAGNPLPTGAAIIFTATEDCTVYYLVLADGSPVPTSDFVVDTGTAVAGILSGEEQTINISGLEDSTSYDIYLVAVDSGGNQQSAPTLVEITTSDGTPPSWMATYPKATVGFTNATVFLGTDENSTAYLLLLSDGATAPTASALRDNPSSVSLACTAGVEASRIFSELSLDTPYDLYLVAQDASGNLQASPTLLEFRTFADVTAPAWQSGYPRLDTTSATGADILVRTDESCSVYALALADGAGAPSSAQVISSYTAFKTVYGGSQSILTVGSLDPVTEYDIYVVARDPSGNIQAAPVKIDALTITVPVDVVLIPEGTNVSIGWVGVYRGEPVHTVPTISAFRMARYETTYDLWVQVRDWALTHGYTFQNAGTNNGATGDCPVVGITWSDVFAWCNAFSQYNGYEPAYFTSPTKTTIYMDSRDSTCDLVAVGTTLADSCVNWSASGYRLPTEAEWEYAARLKADGTLSDGDKPTGCDSSDTVTWADYAWYWTNTGDHKTRAVGQLEPNDSGLYDMSGNAWEICWDWGGSFTTASPYTDPDTHGPAQALGPTTDDAWKIARGGSIHSDALSSSNNFLAVCNRHYTPFTGNYSDFGFRLVRNE